MPVAMSFASNLLLQIKDVPAKLDINGGTLETGVSDVFAALLGVSGWREVGSGKIDDFINIYRTQILVLLRGFLMRSMLQKWGLEKS